MHPSDNEGFVQRPDRAPADDIENRHLPLVMDHREIARKVASCPGGRDNPAPVQPDQPVLHHLCADFVKQCSTVRIERGAFADLPNLRTLDLAILHGNRRYLVGKYVRSPDMGHYPLNLVRLCPPGNHQRFEEIIKSRGKDGALRDRIQLVAGPAHPLHQTGDLAG